MPIPGAAGGERDGPVLPPEAEAPGECLSI